MSVCSFLEKGHDGDGGSGSNLVGGWGNQGRQTEIMKISDLTCKSPFRRYFPRSQHVPRVSPSPDFCNNGQSCPNLWQEESIKLALPF
jgi:hypothetical protein